MTDANTSVASLFAAGSGITMSKKQSCQKK